MATINVRRLDDAVVERLKQRAVANKRSLEGEVRHLLEVAARDDLEARRAAFRVLSAEFRRETAGRSPTPSEILIREDRDSGHRY